MVNGPSVSVGAPAAVQSHQGQGQGQDTGSNRQPTLNEATSGTANSTTHCTHRNTTHRVILLDVEGTTTPITFVKSTLFPYVTTNVHQYLSSHYSEPAVQADLKALHQLQQQDNAAGSDSMSHNETFDALIDAQQSDQPSAALTSALTAVSGYVQQLVRADRKVTPLKSLQGKMWREGYANGDFQGAMFDDVSAAFRRWTVDQSKHVFIYSSGSVQSQQLIFRYSVAGDLTQYISGYFDTTSGMKQEAQSYSNIFNAIQKQLGSGTQASDILFCTDIEREAEAAYSASMDVTVMVRPGNGQLSSAERWVTAKTFEEVQ